MKFFSELGSCWGGAMISPEAEAAGDGRRTEEQGGNYGRRRGETSKRTAAKVKPHGGGVRHWKPKLNAISEDSPASEVHGGGGRQLDGSNAGKPPVRVKETAASSEEDYCFRKSSHTMALPAFSPTSYLF